MAVNDDQARRIESIWKDNFKDSFLIFLPSKDHGVATLTHTSGLGIPLKINSLPSNSPLANNALYSFEKTGNKILNLYEILIPDIPGQNGEESTAQLYINSLRDNGLNVSAIHYHWNGAYIFNGLTKDHLVAAIHHYSTNLSPEDFTNKTISSLKEVINKIKERIPMIVPEKIVIGRVSDDLARRVENIWKRNIKSSSILFLPSNDEGVATLTHTVDLMPMKINGLSSNSPLANNALYSFEQSNGKYINLYEVMLPDIPGKNGELSTVQHYVKSLEMYGLNVSGNHFHWTGATMYQNDRGVLAIHHCNIDMDPIEFSQRTLKALEMSLKIIRSRI